MCLWNNYSATPELLVTSIASHHRFKMNALLCFSIIGIGRCVLYKSSLRLFGFLFVIHSLVLLTTVSPVLIHLESRVAQNDTCPVILKPQPPVDSSTRIVGGRPSGIELASSTVYLVSASKYYLTGVLVAPNIVVAYVGFEFNSSGKVYVGGQNYQMGKTISISKIVRHPLYDATRNDSFLYNVMYVVLASSVSSPYKPTKVSSDPSFPKPGAYVRHIGYGSFGSDKNNGSILHQVDVPVYEQSECMEQVSATIDTVNVSEKRVYCSGYKNHSCSFW